MDLPNFSRGQILTANNLQRLVSAIQAATIQKGIGYTFERNSAGTTLKILPQAQGGSGNYSTTELTPFKIIAGYPADPAYPVVRIHGESYISILETGALYAITGDPALGAIVGSSEDNENDQGQFPLPEIGHSVWLEATVSGYEVTSISIWHGQPSVDGWMNYPNPVEVLPPDEENPYPIATVSRILVAHIVDGSDPRQGDVYSVGTEEIQSRKILQQLNTHLAIQVLMIRGVPTPMLVPWTGPYIVP